MPSMPPAPARFSITTGWPQRAASLSLIARTIRSSELPGPVGTTIFTGRLGQAAWACAAADHRPPAAAAARQTWARTRRRVCFMATGIL
jgi:hypothetical protein